MKYKNQTKKVINIKLNGEWKSVAPGKYIDMPEYLGKNETGLVLEGISTEDLIKEVVEKEVVEKEIEVVEEKYSYTDIKDMKKKEQVAILEKFGLSSADIKKLKNEELRIKKILKLQK